MELYGGPNGRLGAMRALSGATGFGRPPHESAAVSLRANLAVRAMTSYEDCWPNQRFGSVPTYLFEYRRK